MSASYSSSNLLIASRTNSLSWPFPLIRLLSQMPLWKSFFLTVCFQSLSITLVMSTYLICGSFNHFILSTTVPSSSSSSTSSCSIGLTYCTNSFFMNVWSSMSHFLCYSVNSIFLTGFANLARDRGSNDSFAYFFYSCFAFGKLWRNDWAMSRFSLCSCLLCYSIVYEIFIGFQSFKSS